MDGTAGQKTTWPRKLLALFTFRRVRDTKSKAPPETPPKAISASVIVSAENALRGIPIHGAKLGIGASLDVIKKIGLTPALNQETVWSLERNVRLLAELLEPLVYTERRLFPADVEYQLLRLSSDLHIASQTMKQSVSSFERRHRASNRNENPGDVDVFAMNFSLALDRFLSIALPRYTVSTMEAAIRPLGIISNSACGLLPFIDWLRTGRDTDDRFGLIQSIRLCYREYMIEEPLHYDSPPPSTLVCQFLHVGLLNSRGIENWLEIEVAGTSTRGTVTLAATPGALLHGTRTDSVLVLNQALSLVELGIRIEAISDTSIGTPPLGIIFRELRAYGRLVKEDRPVQSPPETVGPISLGLITDGVVRHEVNHDASMETS